MTKNPAITEEGGVESNELKRLFLPSSLLLGLLVHLSRESVDHLRNHGRIWVIPEPVYMEIDLQEQSEQ